MLSINTSYYSASLCIPAIMYNNIDTCEFYPQDSRHEQNILFFRSPICLSDRCKAVCVQPHIRPVGPVPTCPSVCLCEL